ncbi:MAG: hypothetical protein V8R63_06670 [Thomasclavelia ramosa]
MKLKECCCFDEGEINVKQKLLVLCGGQSSEHIVSRMSCTSVLNNLDHEKYDITLVGIDLDGSGIV